MTDETRASWRGAPWETGLDFLKRYVEATGSAEMTVGYETPEGFRLGRWVNTQRVWRRSGKLSPDRERRLDRLGFVWEPKSRAQRARELRDDAMLTWLKAFVSENGHAQVPTNLVLANGTSVGSWVRQVRREQMTGRIHPALERDLLGLGFEFEFLPMDAAFEAGLEALARYVAETGKVHVPVGFESDDGFRLGRWFAGVKSKARRGLLDDAKVAALAELGIDGAHDPREEAWLQNLDSFRRWVSTHGSPHVPKEHVTHDGVRLGQWLAVQRNWLASGRLKDVRSRMLSEVHRDWASTKDSRWDRESAVAAIAEAAVMAYPLTINSYQELRVSGLDLPSISRIYRLFGSWLNACGAAGVEPGPSTVSWRTEAFTDGEVLALLRHHLEYAGTNADELSYETWAAETGAPPASILLRRFDTWREAVRRARSLSDEVLDRA